MRSLRLKLEALNNIWRMWISLLTVLLVPQALQQAADMGSKYFIDRTRSSPQALGRVGSLWFEWCSGWIRVGHLTELLHLQELGICQA